MGRLETRKPNVAQPLHSLIQNPNKPVNLEDIGRAYRVADALGVDFR
jgi:hypothetical protein